VLFDRGSALLHIDSLVGFWFLCEDIDAIARGLFELLIFDVTGWMGTKVKFSDWVIMSLVH
jgi:hypothetical protein